EQLRFVELLEQIDARSQLGRSTPKLSYAVHNRLAYPLMGFAGALLAIGLALRPDRKGHLTAALIEGALISSVLWGVLVSGRALVIAERISAGVAAWTPLVLILLAASVIYLRRDGLLGKSGA